MGVKHLTTFAKKQKDPVLFQQIDILEEIKNWRAESGKAVIIFDMMGFVHNFGRSTTELSLGGRQHIYVQEFERFLIKLREAGATLAFFCDGQLQSDKSDEWCRRRDAEYKNSYQALGYDYHNSDAKPKRFGCKTIVKSLLKLIEDKRFGTIVISTQVDCDVAIAKYAVANNALAVLANDSDFVIFEGDFQWWEANTIQMSGMKANRFERNKIRHLLGLSNEQMKYFATIAGNDYTKTILESSYDSSNYNNNNNNNRFERKLQLDFFEIAKFCKSIHPLVDKSFVYPRIAQFMLGREANNDVLDGIAKSVKSYNIDYTTEYNVSPTDKYCSENVFMYAIHNEKVFQYEANFLDFRERNNNESGTFYLDTLLTVFRKLGGILLKDKADRNPLLRIVTKYSKFENYRLKEHTPIYSQDGIAFVDLIFGSVSDETKWNLLLWSIGMSPRVQFHLKNIPKKYTLTVLALTILFKADEINMMQADAVLLSQYEIIEKYIDDNRYIDKENVSGDAIRVGQMFNRTITMLWDCFMVCGLKQYITVDSFDGLYFKYVLEQFQTSRSFHSDSQNRLHQYRLYAKQLT